MLLDFTDPWGIIRRSDESRADEAADYAEAELSAALGRITGSAPARAEASRESRILVLDSGSSTREPGGPRRGHRFSWRAAEDRVELYGEDGPALVQAVYDFLRSLGVRWVSPGPDGERLPSGTRLELAACSGASAEDAAASALALGHGAFLEEWEAQLVWAARAGYSSVIALVTTDALALGAAPLRLYDRIRPGFAALARRTGLAVELGGLVPRPLAPRAPASGREAEAALAPRTAALAAELALSYPEAAVFHPWPDELPLGGWRPAPARPRAEATADSLAEAAALARALAAESPGAAASFLAGPEDRGLAGALAALGGRLPSNLELLWSPRGRPRNNALRDTEREGGGSSLDAFAEAAGAWKEAGGSRISVLERWEDGLLYKCAVPPMPRALARDIADYRDAGAESIGVLRAGCRLPPAPRPNAFLVPALARGPAGGAAGGSSAGAPAGALLSDWSLAAYGKAAGPMSDYWRELEEAWIIGLDVSDGETGRRSSGEGIGAALDPPADWGDPWRAGLDRLAARRDRCEELFDRLRAAERALGEAREADEGGGPARGAVLAEADEYAISGSILELECARLAAYHEKAAGDARAAADVANLALSASGAVKAALGRVPDRRSRDEARFLIRVFYDLGLAAMRMENARSGLRRLAGLRARAALTALGASRARGAFEEGGRRR